MPKDNQIPVKYLCSITGQVMIDPVIAADGHTYEREAIEEWLQTHDTSPRTNEKLDHKKLTANHDKRSDILDFLDNHPEFYEGDEIYLPNAWLAECVTAIKQNQLQVVQRWLDKDKRLLTSKLEDDSTALHLACEFGSPELVDNLLKNLKQKNESIQPGAIGFKSIHLNVLLERALNNSDYAQCELLLSLGAEVEQPEISTSQNTLLNQMVISENPEALSWFLDKTEISSKNTLLHRMVINDNLEAVSWLVDQKAVLESRNSEGNTPLLLSVIHNHTKLTEFLLKNNANPQVKNAEQQNPVLIALLNQNEPMLSLLVGAEKAALPSLHLALELNDNEIIKSLLNQNIGNIEALDEQQRTPFYSAVERGNLEAATLLLTQGANPTVSCGSAQLSALHIATEHGDIEMLRYLLQTKAAVLIDVQNAKGETPLHLAAHAGRDNIIVLLLEAGAYHKIKNGRDQTPIELARVEQKPEIENLIIQAVRRIKKSKLKEIEKLHQRVSTQASEIEYFKNATLELKNTIEIQEQGFRAKLSDMQAKIKLLQQLIEVGVNFNPTYKHGRIIRNPGVLAVKKGYAAAITVLKTFGANLDTPEDGKTPVYVAAENGDMEAITALKAAGVDVNKSSDNQHYGDNSKFGKPIHIAAAKGHVTVITALKAAGSDIDAPDASGRTPFHIAYENGHVDAMWALQAAGANVNALDKDGKTLIYSIVENWQTGAFSGFSYYNARSKQAQAIATLKALGANADVPDKDGKTPVYVAAEKGNFEAIMALKAVGADVEKARKHNDFRNPIHIAAKNGHAAAITALKAAGADVNAPDRDGSMPIHIAVKNAHIKAIRALKTAGANVNARDRSGNTPAYIVVENRDHRSGSSFHSFDSPITSLRGEQVMAILRVLGSGAIDTPNHDNKTQLFIAAENGSAEAVTALLDAGANAGLRMRNSWKTALQIAKQNVRGEHTEVVKLLEAHLKQYPDGVKPVSIEKEDVSLHASLSPYEHKNSSTLTQFQQSTVLARKSPVAQLQLKTTLKNKEVG